MIEKFVNGGGLAILLLFCFGCAPCVVAEGEGNFVYDSNWVIEDCDGSCLVDFGRIVRWCCCEIGLSLNWSISQNLYPVMICYWKGRSSWKSCENENRIYSYRTSIFSRNDLK